jgi:DNA mismatch endonuclease (patch repair protein)
MCSEFIFTTTPEARRSNMRAIRSHRNKTTELKFRGLIVASRISGWRMHISDLPGRPDFYFPAKRLAVFVDGCFWHSCPNCGHTPRTNSEYWTVKLTRNRERDHRVSRALRREGIKVLRFWECSLRENSKMCLRLLKKALRLRGTKKEGGGMQVPSG